MKIYSNKRRFWESVARTVQVVFILLGVLLFIQGFMEDPIPDMYKISIGGMMLYAGMMCFENLIEAFVDTMTDENEEKY